MTDPAAHIPDQRCPPGCPKCAAEYLDAKEHAEKVAHTPDVDALAETVRNGIPDDYRGPDPNDLDGEKWGPDPEVLAALSDLAATARGNRALAEHNYQAGVAQTERAEAAEADAQFQMEGANKAVRRMDAAEADRDRLARRVAELEAALREIKDEWNDLVSSLIAVEPHLQTPYPDDDRWTPWTRFVERPMHHLDEVIQDALAGDGDGA